MKRRRRSLTNPLLTLPPPSPAGMGDVVSLVEKAEESIKAEEAEEMTRKLMTGARSACAGHAVRACGPPCRAGTICGCTRACGCEREAQVAQAGRLVLVLVALQLGRARSMQQLLWPCYRGL